MQLGLLGAAFFASLLCNFFIGAAVPASASCLSTSVHSTRVRRSLGPFSCPSHPDAGQAIAAVHWTQRLRGAGLDLRGYRPAPLDKTIEWLNATTFDGSEIQGPFTCGWSAENTTLEMRLWMAAELNDGGAAARLVAAGAEINGANAANQTALHKAAMMGHADIYCLGTLIALGANPFAADSRGLLAIDYAREALKEEIGPEEAVTLLEQAMAVVSGQIAVSEDGEHSEGASPWMVPSAIGRAVPIAPELAAAGERAAAEEAAERNGVGGAESRAEQEEESKRKGKRKTKKRYGSVRERWRSLKLQKKRRAARERGEA